MHCMNQSSTTRIVHRHHCCLTLLWQLLCKSTRCLTPPTEALVGGGAAGRGAAQLDVLQVAGVAEEVAVQRVAAVTLLVVELHLTFLTVIAFHVIVLVHGYNTNGFVRPL